MTAYTIKPLEWRFEDGLWRADSIFGQFFTYEPRVGEAGRWALAGWLFRDCDGLSDGKAKAEAYYRERLLAALVPVPDGAQVVGVHYNPNPEGRT